MASDWRKPAVDELPGLRARLAALGHPTPGNARESQALHYAIDRRVELAKLVADEERHTAALSVLGTADANVAEGVRAALAAEQKAADERNPMAGAMLAQRQSRLARMTDDRIAELAATAPSADAAAIQARNAARATFRSLAGNPIAQAAYQARTGDFVVTAPETVEAAK